jgi:hypothetical protein
MLPDGRTRQSVAHGATISHPLLCALAGEADEETWSLIPLNTLEYVHHECLMPTSSDTAYAREARSHPTRLDQRFTDGYERDTTGRTLHKTQPSENSGRSKKQTGASMTEALFRLIYSIAEGAWAQLGLYADECIDDSRRGVQNCFCGHDTIPSARCRPIPRHGLRTKCAECMRDIHASRKTGVNCMSWRQS